MSCSGFFCGQVRKTYPQKIKRWLKIWHLKKKKKEENLWQFIPFYYLRSKFWEEKKKNIEWAAGVVLPFSSELHE